MTIKELIAELQKFPDDKEVFFSDGAVYAIPNRIFEFKPLINVDPYILAKESIVIIDTE